MLQLSLKKKINILSRKKQKPWAADCKRNSSLVCSLPSGSAWKLIQPSPFPPETTVQGQGWHTPCFLICFPSRENAKWTEHTEYFLRWKELHASPGHTSPLKWCFSMEQGDVVGTYFHSQGHKEDAPAKDTTRSNVSKNVSKSENKHMLN